jgi:hypothetical protein
MATAYTQFKQYAWPGWRKPWQPYGQGNLPTLTGAGALQNEPATVGDLYGVEQGGTMNYSGGPSWAEDWRRYSGMHTQTLLGQREREVNADLSRMGLGFSAPGWRQSMMNEPYMQAYQTMAGTEADIGKSMMQYDLAQQQLELQREMAEERPDWLSFFAQLGGSAMSALPLYYGFKMLQQGK